MCNNNTKEDAEEGGSSELGERERERERNNVLLRGLPVVPQSLPVSGTHCHDMLATGHAQTLAYAPVLSRLSQTCGKKNINTATHEYMYEMHVQRETRVLTQDY